MNTDRIYAESIAKEYAPKSGSKISALKRLDARAKHPARLFAYIFGIAATLVAGFGMCLAMRVIGSGNEDFALGIVIGILGFAGTAVNYPIYKKILERGKKKYAFEIVELAREISEGR